MNNRTKKIFPEGKNMNRKETVYCELDNNIYIFSDKTLQHRRQLCMDSLGDAKFRYKEECQSPKDLGILYFFIPIRFPEVQPRPLASMKFVGISVGRNVVRHFRYLHG